MPTRIAAHSGETVFEDSTSEELVDDLADYLAPVAPEVSEALVVDGAELFEVTFDEAIERRVYASSALSRATSNALNTPSPPTMLLGGSFRSRESWVRFS